jgi:23S rRNA (adenine2503-C2)-methyltransferase
MARAGKEKPTNLFGLDRDALRDAVERHGAPAFHGAQIYRWIYWRRELDPRRWTDLSLTLRQSLAETERVEVGTIASRTEADDGTVKYLIRPSEGDAVEAVFMGHGDRVTLCLSSQVGCALGCEFCLTARMGLVRQMSAGEILEQIVLLFAEHDLTDRRFNLVFMGMGEPLHNYDSVLSAVRILTDPEGFGISRRRITISTAGMAPAIERLAGEEVRPRLAVSLNATTDEIRDRLMPLNRRFPLSRLLAACDEFSRRCGDDFTFEYVLLRDVNDSDDAIDRLAGIVRPRPAKLNLIPFNPVDGALPYEPTSNARVKEIRDRLLRARIPVSIRWSRGAEARAACGQLAVLPKEAGARRESRRRS